jgi:hypothetical protein
VISREKYGEKEGGNVRRKDEYSEGWDRTAAGRKKNWNFHATKSPLEQYPCHIWGTLLSFIKFTTVCI